MGGLRIGIVFETFGAYPRRSDDPADYDAEYEPEATIALLEEAFRRLRHEPVRLGTPHDLLRTLGAGTRPRLDAALSIAEGYGSRNREAWAPVLLEMAEIPCVGSDALTLSLSLDKHWTTRQVAAAGVPTPPQASFGSAEEARTAELPCEFPLFVKPRWEGTAKGIGIHSRVEDRPALVSAVERIVRDYRQPALVEGFLSGAEYTVTVVGHRPPRALPVLQRALEESSGIGLHALESQEDAGREWTHALPGVLGPELEARLQELSLRAFEALDCRDFARLDFRLDAAGEPRFLEINTLPTFAPDGSFGILAELEGRPGSALLADVMAEALARIASVEESHESR